MLTKLTKLQEAKFPMYVEKWLDIGLCTDPIDREKSIEAVKLAYRCANLDEPQYFFFFDSPMQAAKGEAYLKTIDDLSTVDEQKMRNDLKYVSKDGLNISSQIYGCHDAAFFSFYEYFLNETEVAGLEQIEGLIAVAKTCGWWAPFRNIAIIQDRPEMISFDERNLLHSETGPAIRYRDGFSVYAWHGTRIPGEWIENKESITPDTFFYHENVEQRRCACEIVGWHKVLEELDAQTIDKSDDVQIGELLEVDLPELGPARFIKVVCGTGRTFAIPVPIEMATAKEANAWTYGLNENQLNIEVRT